MAFNVHVARQVAGLTLRQVRYWDQKGLVKPSVQAATGRGSRRLYSFEDLVELRIVARLRSSGISLQKIARVIGYVRTNLAVREKGLRAIRLLTDGGTVFVRSDDRERWADALRGGQVVWLVPVDEAWREARALVAEMSAPRHESLTLSGRAFDVSFERDLEVGGWVVECPALPGCVSEGSSVPEARRMIRDAIKGWLAVESDRGKPSRHRRSG